MAFFTTINSPVSFTRASIRSMSTRKARGVTTWAAGTVWLNFVFRPPFQSSFDGQNQRFNIVLRLRGSRCQFHLGGRFVAAKVAQCANSSSACGGKAAQKPIGDVFTQEDNLGFEKRFCGRRIIFVFFDGRRQ